MQAGKNAVASAKEAAANIAASAQAGKEKTMATLHEKAERMTAHGPAEKEMATERKQQLVEQAEINKQHAKQLHAAEKQQARAGQTGGVATGGQPAGGTFTEGVVESHPIGLQTGTGGTVAHNPLAGGDSTSAFQGTGGGYTA